MPSPRPSRASRFTATDRYLFGKGDHRRIWEILGGRLVRKRTGTGVHFAVWAPNAKSVAVTGTFNHWNLRSHPMKEKGGIWELFVPGLGAGTMYKFVICAQDGKTWVKADPYALHAQVRPKKSSIVWDTRAYEWGDADWIAQRAGRQGPDAPVSIYEVHLGSWNRRKDPASAFFNYREIADRLVPYLKEMGFTHVECMPVLEHPFDLSWGYQVTNYFAPTSRHGTPDDFKYFVDICHRNGIGVILDWVPAHFPRDPHGLGRFDGTHLYEHADMRKGYHPDWKTYIFNYGRHEVRNFLLANALFWLGEYHVDGLRFDAVASMLYLDYSRKAGQWVPNQYGGNENLEAIDFLKTLNALVHETHPGVLTIAEESTAFSGVTCPTYAGGLGFSLKWNMGWMHDTLEYLSKDPIHRKYHQGKLTFMLHFAFSERFSLVLSHDEVVHGKRSLLRKMPGDRWQKFANLRLLYGFLFAHPGKKTLFMGSEFAQWREWSESREIDWYLLRYEPHRKIQGFVRDLNALYRSHAAMHREEHRYERFGWIDSQDSAQSVISFLRTSPDGEALLFVFNFTPIVRPRYAVGVPREGFWREIFNSDAAIYGGSNVGNSPGRRTTPQGVQNRPHRIEITLPPLAMSVFRYEGI